MWVYPLHSKQKRFMLDWLFNKPGYRRFDDSYALTRHSLQDALRCSIEQRSGPNQVVFLVAHFPDIFCELQEALDVWNIPYDVIRKMINRRWMEQILPDKQPPVFLTMAEMFEPEMSSIEPIHKTPEIAIMVAERHPLDHHDREIEKFARQIPWPVELGYFLAMDDEIMNHFVNPDLILLLKQLGLREHELISSHMVTRRLNQATKKMSRNVEREQQADSAQEWFRLNHPKRNQGNGPSN